VTTFIEYLAGAAVEVVIIGVAGGILYRVWRGASFLPQRRTLVSFNRGVILEGERVVRVIDSGSCWITSKQSLVPVDIRARPFQTERRGLATGDKRTIVTYLHGEYKVIDPAIFILASTDGHAAFRMAMEREVGRAAAELTRDEILESTSVLAERVKERIEPRVAELGIGITHLEVADLLPAAWGQYDSED
jgi:hypothetical protein